MNKISFFLISILLLIFSCDEGKKNQMAFTDEESEEMELKLIQVQDEAELSRNFSDLKYNIEISELLINDWVNNPSRSDNRNKAKLKEIMNKTYPELKDKINLNRIYLERTELEELDVVLFDDIDSLFGLYKEIEYILPDLESGQDFEKVFIAGTILGEEMRPLAEKIKRKLQYLSDSHNFYRKKKIKKADQE
jgi:hypothetical protein